MDPLQNRTFSPAISIFHLYFPKVDRPVCQTMHANAFPITGCVGTGREGYGQRKHRVTILIGCPYSGLRCRSKYFLNLRNFQIWRPAVTDPHKVRPCIYRGSVALTYRNRFWRFLPCIYKSFGVLAVWWTPFRIGHFPLQFPYFTYISPQMWQTSVAKLMHPNAFPIYRVGRHVYVGDAQRIYCPTIPKWLPLLQGSDAGEIIFKFEECSNLTSSCDWPA